MVAKFPKIHGAFSSVQCVCGDRCCRFLVGGSAGPLHLSSKCISFCRRAAIPAVSALSDACRPRIHHNIPNAGGPHVTLHARPQILCSRDWAAEMRRAIGRLTSRCDPSASTFYTSAGRKRIVRSEPRRSEVAEEHCATHPAKAAELSANLQVRDVSQAIVGPIFSNDSRCEAV